jgi:transglutaminase-like putative cysteine protease
MQTITPTPVRPDGTVPATEQSLLARLRERVPLRLVRGTESRLMLTWNSRPIFLFWPEDGWLAVFLLSFCVYITILSIQSVTPAWAPGMGILTATTVLGLFLGLVAALQRLIPQYYVHSAFALLGGYVAFAETASVATHGDRLALLNRLGLWYHQATHNLPSNDNAIFLLFLAVLSFLLAYISMWLVLRSHRPLLALIANGVVLLINLNFASDDKLVFLVLFLLAGLLLLVRFSLAENMRHWRLGGLRFSPDLSWDVMQTGAIFAVIVLLLAYLLPAASPTSGVAKFFSNPRGPFGAIEQRFESLFNSVNGPGNGNGLSFFSGNLPLKGTVDLPNAEVLRYTSDAPNQYLVTQTFDTFDGHVWTQSLGRAVNVRANELLPIDTSNVRIINQTLFLTHIGTGSRQLFAGDLPASFSVPSDVSQTLEGNTITSYYSQDDLIAGQRYTASSYVPTATIGQLENVPFPGLGGGSYPPDVLSDYLNNDNTSIDPLVAQTAQQWTRGTTTMYDAAIAIESHLRVFTYSTHNGEVPSNEDAVVWFLQNKKGFCTFFASAMALMARSLGIPARVAEGFTNGQLDDVQKNYVVRGTDAHVWTQLYFAGYGWIDFEPTQTFNVITRATPGGTATATGATGTTTPGGPQPTKTRGSRPLPTESLGGGGGGGGGAVLRDLGISLAFLAALVVLLIAAFAIYWRALYRGLPPIAAAFGRAARLGAWVGVPPRPNQTPYEYADAVGQLVPEASEPLHRLSELYVAERWGGARASADEASTPYAHARRALTQAITRRLTGVVRLVRDRLRSYLGGGRSAARQSDDDDFIFDG